MGKKLKFESTYMHVEPNNNNYLKVPWVRGFRFCLGMRNGEGEGPGLALAPLASLEAKVLRGAADRRTDLAAAKDDMAAFAFPWGFRNRRGFWLGFGFAEAGLLRAYAHTRITVYIVYTSTAMIDAMMNSD